MDIQNLYIKLVNNRVNYDEALRFTGYLERLERLLNYPISSKQKLLDAVLELQVSKEMAEEAVAYFNQLEQAYDEYLKTQTAFVKTEDDDFPKRRK